MGKKKGGKAEGEETKSSNEGHNLLGPPSFQELDNGRYRCVETGHELPAHAKDSYSQSKHCRLGLIDSALARKKPPLNMFRQDPQSSSKLICKLTGDIINKNEEHIWKHINGKRFLNTLERKELEKLQPNCSDGKKSERKAEKKKKKKVSKPESSDKNKKKHEENGRATKGDNSDKNKEKCEAENGSENISEVKNSSGKENDAEEEFDFWMPPVGERWDNDDGGDRWGSDSESGPEDGNVDEQDEESNVEKHDDEELTRRTKRMSLEIGPSSFASRKKKNKTLNT